jgi:HAD superfamily hydrolase (TIGR01509 family)
MSDTLAAAIPSPSPSSPSVVQACLFDIDGTLSDTDVLHRLIFKDFLNGYGYNCDDEFFNARVSGRDNASIAADLLPQLSQEEATRIFDEKEEQFRVLAETRLIALPGLLPLLHHLKSCGIPIIAVTNAPKDNAHMMLRVIGVTDLFEKVVLGEECEAAKPSPVPYQVGMKAAGAIDPSKCIVFEDSPTGAKAGVDAGCVVVGVRTSQTDETLRKIGCQYTVADFTELDLEKLTREGKDFVRNAKQGREEEC